MKEKINFIVLLSILLFFASNFVEPTSRPTQSENAPQPSEGPSKGTNKEREIMAKIRQTHSNLSQKMNKVDELEKALGNSYEETRKESKRLSKLHAKLQEIRNLQSSEQRSSEQQTYGGREMHKPITVFPLFEAPGRLFFNNGSGGGPQIITVKRVPQSLSDLVYTKLIRLISEEGN